MRTITLASRASLIGLAMFTLVACSGGSRDAGGDTAAATSTTASAAGTATAGDSMAGMDHSSMPGMNMPPAKDADQEFLRMMVDHHEGLIQMMDPAMEKASSPTAKADAKKLHDKQHQEQDQMIQMLKSSYSETKEPMVLPSNQQMVDDLANTPAGPAYDKKMYGHVVMHHQEAIKMINDFQPRLTKPELKQMVQKMKDDQQKEIQEFQRKASA
jgi:uncharacterized protein (DUF305 family)